MPRKSRPADVPWPLSCREWKLAIRTLRFTPQQVRIVELLVQAKKEKEITEELAVHRATLRSHMLRLFDRLQVNTRLGIVVRIFQEMWEQRRRK